MCGIEEDLTDDVADGAVADEVAQGHDKRGKKKDRADLVEDLVFKGKSHVEDIDQREDRDHADQKKNRKKPLGRVAQFMREEIRGAVVHFFFRV